MSPQLVLVRHGRPAGGWTDDPDPGLDETGRRQAEAMADMLAPIGPLPVLTSPLRRTQETAAPLTRRWEVEAVVEPGVGEIPSPDLSVSERGGWLAGVLASSWDRLDGGLQRWRRSVLDTLAAVPDEAVIVTHFVAINVAVGAATGDLRVMCSRPDHCSRTVIEIAGDEVTLVELGAQAETTVR